MDGDEEVGPPALGHRAPVGQGEGEVGGAGKDDAMARLEGVSGAPCDGEGERLLLQLPPHGAGVAPAVARVKTDCGHLAII